MGSDSKTLFVSNLSDIDGYDLSAGNTVGQMPNVFVWPYFKDLSVDFNSPGPVFQATNGSGIYAGPLQEGVGFVDMSALGSAGTPFTTGSLSPATGPSSGGTATTWQDASGVQASLSAVYFGSQPATGLPSAPTSTFSATTPPGPAGPVDVYALAADGSIQLLPEGFSYGPTVLEVTPNMAVGGSGSSSANTSHPAGTLFGYGLGPAGSSSIPSDLRISVGGQAAQITAFNGNAYGSTMPPFPLQSVAYNIPPGGAGPADVTLTTSSGSTTVHGGMNYLPPVELYPLPGAALAQGVYDPHNDLYYFTDATQIQVFSKTEGAWLAPIPLPNAQRLWGIALSQDGTLLAVGDMTGGAIYVLNPLNPSSVQRFGMSVPVGLAVTDAGLLYLTSITSSSYGNLYFEVFNTANGSLTTVGYKGFAPPNDTYSRVQYNSSSGLAYFNSGGRVFSAAAGTGAPSYATADSGCCYGNDELTLSGDGTRLAATGYFYDSNLSAESYFGLNVREAMNVSYVYGQKLSADGSLLFQPTTLGIDVMDGHLGNLIDRIALPVALSPNYDALVADGKDNILVAITGANGDGVAVLDFSSIAEPPLPSFDAAMGSSNSRSAAKAALPARANRPRSMTHGERRGWPLFLAERVPHVTSQRLLHPQQMHSAPR
jgi:hypothetical protein